EVLQAHAQTGGAGGRLFAATGRQHRFRIGLGFGDGDLEGALATVTEHPHVDLAAVLRGADHRWQVALGDDLAAVEDQDHVAHLDPGLLGGTVGHHGGNQGANRTIQAQGFGKGAGDLLDLHADLPTAHATVALELLDDVLRDIDGNGEADAHVAAGAGEDLRVDADHLAGQVEQRTTGIAGVDRHVGLDERNVLL